MNRTIKRILIIAISLSAASCVKEKLATTYNNQETKIDQYISSNMYVTSVENGQSKTDTLRVVYNGGSNRLVMKEGNGDALNHTGIATIYYAGYIFSGSKSSSNLFITNHEETAKSAGWELSDSEDMYKVYRLNMADTDLITGLKNGLIGVKSGEHCQILFSGKYAFGKKPIGIIPANSAILYEIWVEAVSND